MFGVLRVWACTCSVMLLTNCWTPKKDGRDRQVVRLSRPHNIIRPVPHPRVLARQAKDQKGPEASGLPQGEFKSGRSGILLAFVLY
jgi:hypothetical protein